MSQSARANIGHVTPFDGSNANNEQRQNRPRKEEPDGVLLCSPHARLEDTVVVAVEKDGNLLVSTRYGVRA
jgi:hypothetical protein